MEPVTLIVGAVLGAAAVSGSWIAVAYRRHRRKKLMRGAVRKRLPCGDDVPVSAFELFWDLGASEYALEIMAEGGLLLESPDRLPWLYEAMPQRIAEFGSYDSYVAANLEAIEQFYDEHKNRQRPLELKSPERRLMRLPAYTGPLIEDGPEIDLDQVSPDPINMVSSLLKGDPSGLVQLITGGGARSARKELDRALAGLYRIYADHNRARGRRASPLERSAAEWDAEAMRLVRMATERRWADEPWAACADALVEEAQELARGLAEVSRDNVTKVLERIDYLAEKRDEPAAGHLVYVNRSRLLPAGSPAVDAQLSAIEASVRELQDELD